MRSVSGFILVLFVVCLGGVQAQDPYQVNVTVPTPGQNFVAGQKLPLVYRTSANATTSTINLSISLVDPNNATNSVLLFANADISQGFSQQVTLPGGTIVYEHQENYNIPTTQPSGNYNVVFTNNVNGANITIPIIIAQPVISQTSTTAPPSSVTNVIGGGGSWGSGNSVVSSHQWATSLILAICACAALLL